MRRPIARCLFLSLSALTLGALSSGASAHHSSAMFDPSRSLDLQGIVSEFRWANPHVFIDVVVTGDDGREERWSIEMNSPELLARDGWRPDALRAGDAVSLVVHPRRDDGNGGQYLSGTGPRGSLIAETLPEVASAQTLSSAVVTTSCPRVEVTLVESSASPETRPVKLEEQTISVRRDAITTTRDIAEIAVAGDGADALISIAYTPQAAARLLEATTDRDGVEFAFVVDDEVWLAFTWRGPYGIGPEGTQVSVRNGLARAERLMESIRDCTGAQTR
jgi:hypothetical protein